MESQKQFTKKQINLRTSKVAIYWRNALYLISAGVCAVTLLDFSREDWIEGIGNLGLTMIFAGLCCRSAEAAAMAYIKDVAQRQEVILKLRAYEKLKKPWVGFLVRTGWFLMLAGLGLELAGFNY